MRWTRAGASGLAAAAIAALVYGATLAPTVGAGDSGELILAADSLSIPHPPGYPVWLLLARAAALIPVGAVAWRINVLSAALSAAAVGLFYLLALRVGIRRNAAALATAFFGASTLVWRSAVEAEVYPLATLLFLALGLLALRSREDDPRAPRYEALFFFAAGLAPLVHQTLAAPALILAAWVLAKAPRAPRAPRLLRAALLAAAGFSVFFVIPLRTAAAPAASFDHHAGFAAALGELLRTNYGAMQQNPFRFDFLGADLSGMGAEVAAGVGIPAAFLAAFGLLRIRREGTVLPLVLAAASIPAGLALLLVFTPDAEHLAQVAPFLAPVAAVVCLAAGFGATELARGLTARWRPMAAAALAACALVTILVHARACDRTGFRLAERYGRDLVRDLPNGSTLILDGDNETFLAGYATRIEHLRPDVTLIHRRGYLFGDPYGLHGVPRSQWVGIAHEVDLQRLEKADRPIYYATPPADLVSAGVRFESAGLVHRATRTVATPAGDSTVAWLPPAGWPRSTDLLPGSPKRYDYVTRKLAVSYSDAAARALWDQGRRVEAFAWFEDAAQVGYDNVGARLNLATAAATVGRPDLALSELLAARSLAPHDPNPAARLAIFMAAAGQYRDAALWFERAYEVGPAPALASDAARAWSLAGDEARAREWRGRAG